MLPRRHKLTSPAEFKRTIRGGRRGGSRTLVVHVHDRSTEPGDPDPSLTGGPRFGLVVSKAVGNAVTRHTVSRRLRHCAQRIVDKLPCSTDIVIRALPAAGTADSARLAADLHKALRKAGLPT